MNLPFPNNQYTNAYIANVVSFWEKANFLIVFFEKFSSQYAKVIHRLVATFFYHKF